MPTEAQESQRVTVSLPAEAVAFLKDEAARTNSSMADVLRQSIANNQFLQTARSNGADVLLSEPGKPMTRIIFR